MRRLYWQRMQGRSMASAESGVLCAEFGVLGGESGVLSAESVGWVVMRFSRRATPGWDYTAGEEEGLWMGGWR